MKGQIKVLGASKSFKSLIGYDGYGSLLSINEKTCLLQLGEEKITYEIYKTVYAENHVECEGWSTDKNSNFGKIALKFTSI